MKSPMLAAFDLTKEDEKVRDAYGKSDFGKGCLLARRLVETGVNCVEIQLGGWDTHQNNFPQVEKLSSVLDSALSELLRELRSRGLLKDTLVVCLGEFGRTPKINPNGGRDHFPATWSAVLAGGGIKGARSSAPPPTTACRSRTTLSPSPTYSLHCRRPSASIPHK